MNEYTVYQCSKTGRLMICSERPKYRVKTVTKLKADTWIEAKQKFLSQSAT